MARKTKDVRNITLSDFYCTKCGMKGIPVFRTIGQEREPGHHCRYLQISYSYIIVFKHHSAYHKWR